MFDSDGSDSRIFGNRPNFVGSVSTECIILCVYDAVFGLSPFSLCLICYFGYCSCLIFTLNLVKNILFYFVHYVIFYVLIFSANSKYSAN